MRNFFLEEKLLAYDVTKCNRERRNSQQGSLDGFVQEICLGTGDFSSSFFLKSHQICGQQLVRLSNVIILSSVSGWVFLWQPRSSFVRVSKSGE